MNQTFGNKDVAALQQFCHKQQLNQTLISPRYRADLFDSPIIGCKLVVHNHSVNMASGVCVSSGQDGVLVLICSFSLQTTRSEFDSCEYEVRRRYQDFVWLRSRLEENHPTLIISVCIRAQHRPFHTSVGCCTRPLGPYKFSDVSPHEPQVTRAEHYC